MLASVFLVYPLGSEANRAAVGFHARRFTKTGAGWFSAELESLLASVHGGFWKNFQHFFLARFTHGNMAIISSDFVAGSLGIRCLGVACRVRKIGSSWR